MLKCWIDTRLIYTSRVSTGFVHCTFQAFVTFTRTDAAHLSRTLEALRRTSFTPRFHSYPSLAVTGIDSGCVSRRSGGLSPSFLSLLLVPADLQHSSLANIILVDFRSISPRIRPTVLESLLGESSRSLIVSPSSS